MSEVNQSLAQASAEAAGAAEAATQKNQAKSAPKVSVADASEGSFLSHLLFGLGTLVFVLPMLIPGVSMVLMAVVYGGMFIAMTVAFVIWSIVARLKERRH